MRQACKRATQARGHGGMQQPVSPPASRRGERGLEQLTATCNTSGGELSTKEKLPAGSVAPAVWEEAPSKRTAPGSARHRAELLPQPDARSIPPVRSLGSGVEFKLRSSSLCETPRPSSRPARGPGGKAGGEGHRRAETRGNPKEAKPRPLLSYPGAEKAHRRALLPHPETIWGSTASRCF